MEADADFGQRGACLEGDLGEELLSGAVASGLCVVWLSPGVHWMDGVGRFPAVQPGGEAGRGNPPLFFSCQHSRNTAQVCSATPVLLAASGNVLLRDNLPSASGSLRMI